MTASNMYFVAVAFVALTLCSATQNVAAKNLLNPTANANSTEFEMLCPTGGCPTAGDTNALTNVTTKSLVSCAMTCVQANSWCQAVTYIENTGQCQLWQGFEPAVAIGSIGFKIAA